MNRSQRIMGGVLVGGRSTRMGRPKQLLARAGRSYAEWVAGALRPHVREVVWLGSGEIDGGSVSRQQLPDVPDVPGPMAGILAALRWASDATWVIVACDMPLVTPAAVRWLLERREEGAWAVLPRRGEGAEVEPLLALYEPPARELLEELVARHVFGPHRLAASGRVRSPVIPEHLRACWTNVNTPQELDELERG